MDYVDVIRSKNLAPKTTENYINIVERLWKRIGERMFDLEALNAYLNERGFVSGTCATYLWAVAAALEGTPVREEFERAAGLMTGASRSLDEKRRRAANSGEQLAPVIGEYEDPLQEMIDSVQRVINSGVKEDKNGFLKKVPVNWIRGYRSFIIDCKMKMQGAPPRSDFCNVYSSKKHADDAGGGSYYDREMGALIFVSRVKDPNGIKETNPFDVLGIQEDLNAFVDNHQHPKLLNREMNETGYNSWVGDMTEQFGRCRMGTIVQRKMYVNKPTVRAAIEETAEREERMGHTNRTAAVNYKLPGEVFAAVMSRKHHIEDKENDEPVETDMETDPKRQRCDEKSELEKEAVEFAENLFDDLYENDEDSTGGEGGEVENADSGPSYGPTRPCYTRPKY